MTCESSNHITDKNLKEQIIKEKRRDHKGTLVPLKSMLLSQTRFHPKQYP